MSYKSELQANNADLQTILDTVNALPDAGGGGGGEVATKTVHFAFYAEEGYEGVTQYVVVSSKDEWGDLPAWEYFSWTVVDTPTTITLSAGQLLAIRKDTMNSYEWYEIGGGCIGVNNINFDPYFLTVDPTSSEDIYVTLYGYP